jgi:Ca-activated chloride channel homolog
VSFAAPWLLLGLVLVPLLVLAYGLTERRRRRTAAAFAAPPTAVSAVPRRPGWRRHAPLALAGLAMAGLIVALARPQVSVAVPAEQASIVLTMDRSGSMQATDVAPSRLIAARDAGEAFLAEVPASVGVGAVVFDHRTEAVQNPTTDRSALRDALRDAMKPSGGTATGDALAASLAMLEAQRGTGAERPPGAIVLLSDGESTSGRDPVAVADEARAAGVPIYTVALGTPDGTLPDGKPVPPDIASLQAIAERSGGEAFTARAASRLSAVYERLGSQVAMKEERREITGAFAGGAIALLLVGGGLSLRWFRRLI